MKFASVIVGGRASFGLVEEPKIYLATDVILSTFPDLKAAIRGGDFAGLATRLKAEAKVFDVAAVTLAPPIPNPDKIFCVGLNYVKHRQETGRGRTDYPAHPVIFARFAASLTGHRMPILKPLNSAVVDYEGELAAVIGKPGRRIPEDRALEHVAGYSCFNDVSMRDWQMQSSQWIPGKNFPTSGPFGPYLVTRDEVGPLDDLVLRTILDGQLMQEAPFRDFVHPLPRIIAYVSGFTELQPGDVIVAGTPGGVGFTREPPILLDPGKTVEVTIDRIGRLVNPVIAEKA